MFIIVHYYPYDPQSTIRVEETLRIAASKVFLRHIPKQGSVFIDGFTETDSLIPAAHQFSCDYALDSLYRDANRVLNFNATHNGETVIVSYIAIGTVWTADDANEIKAHLESPHGYSLPTASTSTKGGVKIGDGFDMQDGFINVNLTKAVEHPVNQFETTVKEVTSLPTASWSFYRLNGGNGGIILPANVDTSFNLLGDNQRVLTRGTDYSVNPPYEGDPAYVSIPSTTFDTKITQGKLIVRWGDIQTSIGKIILGTGLTLDGDTLNASAQGDYDLPTMGATIKGGGKVGNSLKMTGDTLNVALGTTPLTLEGSMWIHVP